MTTKTIKEDAENVIKTLQLEFQGKKWFKKAILSTDDLGWSVDLHIDKTAMKNEGFRIPLEKNVKICVFNKN